VHALGPRLFAPFVDHHHVGERQAADWLRIALREAADTQRYNTRNGWGVSRARRVRRLGRAQSSAVVACEAH
jgi:hypothetical protein